MPQQCISAFKLMADMENKRTLLGRNAISWRAFQQRKSPGWRAPGFYTSHPAPSQLPNLHGYDGLGKRIFDRVLAGAALVFLLPLLLVTALAVKITSPGPVLFWSARDDGRGGTFMMPKFRTMLVGAPVQPREQFANASASMTPPGEFLRRSSIDELPQILPVLAGKMSLIGPRPLLPGDPGVYHRKLLSGQYQPRPGITGLAQVSGRNRLSPRRKARYDQFYTQHWSWRLDLWILMRTVKVVTSRSGVM